MKQNYYDPWAQVGQAANDAALKYLTTRPNETDIALKKAQIANMQSESKMRDATMGKTALETQLLQNQVGAPDNIAKIFGDIFAQYQPPAPSEEFVGPMPSGPAPADVVQQRYQEKVPELMGNAMRFAGDKPGSLGDIYAAFAANGGASQQGVDRAMLGAGKPYESTMGGSQQKMLNDPTMQGGATGANIRAYIQSSAAQGRNISYDQAWREMYGGAVKSGAQVNPATGQYEPIPGYDDVKRGTNQAGTEGTKTGEMNIARQANYTKAQSALVGFKQKADMVTKTVDKALALANKDWSTATGGVGSVLTLGGALPIQTDRREMNNLLTTINANLGFDQLQTMRDNSPTGGALGQVSDMENRLLQAVNGALDPVMGDQLKANLQTIKELYPQVMAEKQRAFDQDYGTSQPFGNNPVAPVQRSSENAGPGTPGGNLIAQATGKQPVASPASGIKFLGFE